MAGSRAGKYDPTFPPISRIGIKGSGSQWVRGVGFQYAFDVGIGNVRQAPERPVFAYLREPAYASVFCGVQIRFCDEPVECTTLISPVFFAKIACKREMCQVIFLLDASTDDAKTCTC